MQDLELVLDLFVRIDTRVSSRSSNISIGVLSMPYMKIKGLQEALVWVSDVTSNEHIMLEGNVQDIIYYLLYARDRKCLPRLCNVRLLKFLSVQVLIQHI